MLYADNWDLVAGPLGFNAAQGLVQSLPTFLMTMSDVLGVRAVSMIAPISTITTVELLKDSGLPVL